MRHFTHQVMVIRKFVHAPHRLDIFLGNLGTGIVGVRPKRRASDSSAAEIDGDALTPPAPKGHVILFLNVGAGRLQERDGRTMAGFSAVLDRPLRTLRWESQRADRRGRMIGKISEHVRSGGELVVAVRSAPGNDFKILGPVADFQPESDARFLVDAGDNLLVEQGSRRIHKAVRAQCLDAGLRAGVGLLAVKYPLPQALASPRYCRSCCWAPATARIIFHDLDVAAAALFEGSAIAAPVAAAGAAPGAALGAVPVVAPGACPGAAPGAAQCVAPGAAPGAASGEVLGEAALPNLIVTCAAAGGIGAVPTVRRPAWRRLSPRGTLSNASEAVTGADRARL